MVLVAAAAAGLKSRWTWPSIAALGLLALVAGSFYLLGRHGGSPVKGSARPAGLPSRS